MRLIQANLDNSKLPNCEFWLIRSEMLVPAIPHVIQWKKLLDNLKLKLIMSVNWKLFQIKSIVVTVNFQAQKQRCTLYHVGATATEAVSQS